MGVGEQQEQEQDTILLEPLESQLEVVHLICRLLARTQISITWPMWTALYILPIVPDYWRLVIKLCHLKYLGTLGVVMFGIMKTKGNIPI